MFIAHCKVLRLEIPPTLQMVLYIYSLPQEPHPCLKDVPGSQPKIANLGGQERKVLDHSEARNVARDERA